MSQHSFTYGQNTIRFVLEQKPRKSFKISVMPDLSVGVSAPQNVSVEKVLLRVQKKAPWIVRQIEYFKSFMPKEPPKQFISGETHCYYGRQYRLKVIQSKRQVVRLKGKYIFVYSLCPDNRQQTKRLLYDWYWARARKMFESITKRSHGRIEKYGINLPALNVKTMKSRWGSCLHTKGRIGLNTELIKAPSHCIEYVIMHEMCHLKYPNHTKHFYKFLTLVMPDWVDRKERLEKVGLQ